MLNEKHGMFERIRRCDVGSALFEAIAISMAIRGSSSTTRRSARQEGVMHKCSIGAAKRKEPEARGAVWPLMSQAVDQSSNAQQAL